MQGLLINCNDTGLVSTLWDAYSYLDNVASSCGRFFPQPLGVHRMSQQSSLLFVFEYPAAAVSLTSLIGPSLARALREDGDIAIVWCQQLAEVRRRTIPLSCCRLHSPALADVFVRESGTLILGNMLVSAQNSFSGSYPACDYDLTFSKFVCSLLAATLDTSRCVALAIGQGVSSPKENLFDLTIAEGSVLSVVIEGFVLPTRTGSIKQYCRVFLDEESEEHTDRVPVNHRYDCNAGDLVLTFTTKDSTVSFPWLRQPNKSSLHSLEEPRGWDTGVVGDGKIYLELKGQASGIATYTLSRIDKDFIANAIAVIRLNVISYPVSANAELDELICLLDSSECSPLSDDHVFRVLGCKILSSTINVSACSCFIHQLLYYSVSETTPKTHMLLCASNLIIMFIRKH